MVESSTDQMLSFLEAFLDEKVQTLSKQLAANSELLSQLSKQVDELHAAKKPLKIEVLNTSTESGSGRKRPSTTDNRRRQEFLKAEESKSKKEEEDHKKEEGKGKKEEEDRKKEETKHKKEEEDRKKEEAKKKLAEEKAAKEEAKAKKLEEIAKKKEADRLAKQQKDEEAKKEKARKEEEAKAKKEEEKKQKEVERKQKEEELAKKKEQERLKKEEGKKEEGKKEEVKKKPGEKKPDPKGKKGGKKEGAKEPETKPEETKGEEAKAEDEPPVPEGDSVDKGTKFVGDDDLLAGESEEAHQNVLDDRLALVEEETQKMERGHPPEILSQTKPFALSIGSKSALILLANLDDGVFHLTTVPEEDVIWTFRVFFQLRNDPLPPNDEEAWTRCQAFLGSLLQSKETLPSELQKVFSEQLVFSDENIDQVELLVKGKEDKLDPAIYSDSSALVGILMFPLKDAASYCGLLPEKIEPWRRYQRLLHKKRQLQGS